MKHLKLLIGVIILALVVGMAYREQLIRRNPSYVRHYQKIMKKISSPDYIEKLNNYTNFGRQMHYSWLLTYLGEKVTYTEERIIRHEDPIEILEYGLGRCGEFAIAYTALCIANGWDTRLILDASSGEGNGDHVWTELYIIPPYPMPVFGWVHVDPTEGAMWTQKNPLASPYDNPYINNPYMYERDWKKECKEVWGIESDFVERVEDNYQWEP